MTTHPTTTTARPAGQVHRAAGALLAAACGDALGVPYEFGTSPHRPRRPRRRAEGWPSTPVFDYTGPLDPSTHRNRPRVQPIH